MTVVRGMESAATLEGRSQLRDPGEASTANVGHGPGKYPWGTAMCMTHPP